MRCSKLSVPVASAGSAEYPLSTINVKFTTGAVWRSASTIFRPLLSVDFSSAGSLSDTGSPAAGSFERSSLPTVLIRGWIGLHLEHVVAVAEPVDRGFLHRRRSSGLHPRQIVLVAIGIAAESLAASEQDRSCRRSRRCARRCARTSRGSASWPAATRRESGRSSGSSATLRLRPFPPCLSLRPGLAVSVKSNCPPISLVSFDEVALVAI